MTYVQHHNLATEFPELKETLHALKQSDAHFAKLYHEYEELDKEICRIEEDIEPASEDRIEQLKTRRVYLKDELYARLTGAK